MIVLVSTAFALTCAPGDEACEQANTLRDRLNTWVGPDTIADGHPSVRRRTETIQARLEQIHAAADAAGCTITGVDFASTDHGDFDGRWRSLDGSSSGGQDGSFDDDVFSGRYRGPVAGPLGDWGTYSFKAGKLVGARAEDGFVVGGLARLGGRNGAVWGVHGTCPGDIAEAFTPYLGRAEAYVGAEPPGIQLPYQTGFESPSLGFEWTTSGNHDWTVNSNIPPHSGARSAAAGPFLNGQHADLTLETFIPSVGVLRFYRATSTENNGDYLILYVDGVARMSWSGGTSWAEHQESLDYGPHTITFRYQKDPSGTAGLDMVFIDDLTIQYL